MVGLGVAALLVAALGAGTWLGTQRRESEVTAGASATSLDQGGTTAPQASTSVPTTTPTVATTVVPPTTADLPATTVPPAGARYAFPVTGKATYGRSHHDYPAADLFAPCGTPIVAPTSGTLTELRRTDAWSAKNDTGATRGGLSFTLVGDDGVRYYGSHLESVAAAVAVGTRVEPGREIGQVGNSGNARGIACHLHFGISPPCPRPEWRVRRGTIYPQPFLDSWRQGGSDSPSAAIRLWAAANPSACTVAAELPDAAAS